MGMAIKEHGIVKGIWLGTKRLLRCHPWGKTGCDPVPSKIITKVK
jgi:putative component of membrane protein insertase Oxa1/YidC/SpoIIIJ protein YidD